MIAKFREEEVAALQVIWNIYAAKFAATGRNASRELSEWIGRQLARIEGECGANIEFDVLVGAGCQPAMLAVLTAALRVAPRAAGFRKLMFGSPRLRAQVIRSASRTAKLLERAFPPHLEDPAVAARVTEVNGFISPSRIIKWLTEFSGMLSFVDAAPRITGVRSIEEAARFFLCAYVEDATGKPHNAEVAALVGCALGSSSDTTAHGMWRARNFRRLAKALERPRPAAPAVAELLRRNVT